MTNVVSVRVNPDKDRDLSQYIDSIKDSEIRGYQLRTLLRLGYQQLQKMKEG